MNAAEGKGARQLVWRQINDFFDCHLNDFLYFNNLLDLNELLDFHNFVHIDNAIRGDFNNFFDH